MNEDKICDISNCGAERRKAEEAFPCCNHRHLQPPLLPPIITHFHDVQSTLEKSFVSFQHFPPPSSQLPGSRPLIISVDPTMLDHSLSVTRFHFYSWVWQVTLCRLMSWYCSQPAPKWFQIRRIQCSLNF